MNPFHNSFLFPKSPENGSIKISFFNVEKALILKLVYMYIPAVFA